MNNFKGRRPARRGGQDRRRQQQPGKHSRGYDRPRKMKEPELPEGVSGRILSSSVHQQLTPLSREHREVVSNHLAAAGTLIDSDPEAAYQHARYAVESAGRIAATREALGLVAYRLGKYDEALRELRTHKRITGATENIPVIADAERGREKPQKALDMFAEAKQSDFDPQTWIEFVLVVAGAHMDLDNLPAAKALIEAQGFTGHAPGSAVRLLSMYADILRAHGDTETGDKYEQLARRTAQRTNVLFGDETPDPNEGIQIITLEEEPELEPEEELAEEEPATGEPDEKPEPEDTSAPDPNIDVEDEVDEILEEAGIDPETVR
ncbi:tetratricopeptide repeat protein [Brevibacterium paucivorans]